MRITALSGLLIVVTGLFAASGEETPFSRLAALANALKSGDAPSALELFDPQTKNIGEIGKNIRALTAQDDVLCAIDIVNESDDGDVHKLDTDWYMELKPQSESTSGSGGVERRRVRVAVEMTRTSGHWKIRALSPVSVLEPAHPHF